MVNEEIRCCYAYDSTGAAIVSNLATGHKNLMKTVKEVSEIGKGAHESAPEYDTSLKKDSDITPKLENTTKLAKSDTKLNKQGPTDEAEQ